MCQQPSETPTLPCDQQTQELLTMLVKALVDRPEEVGIRVTAADQTTIFEATVNPQDVRRLVGRGGRTATAIRELVQNLAGKARRRYHFEIVEPANRVTVPLDM